MTQQKKAICTVVTEDYIPLAHTLYDSILKQSDISDFFVLVVNETPLHTEYFSRRKTIHYLNLKDIENTAYAQELIEKYEQENFNSLRWSLKSVLIHYLLNKEYEKVMFLDCDIYFFNQFEFLWNELDNYNILLTPHWRNPDPIENEVEFLKLFRDGHYNAGFIAVNSQAKAMLEWWAKLCLYSCTMDYARALFVDQGYLNLVPIYFEKVHILRHQGCNVAEWNREVCIRTINNDKQVKIQAAMDIIFIHFSTTTIAAIKKGNDSYLESYLNYYLDDLYQNGFSYPIERLLQSKDLPKEEMPSPGEWINTEIDSEKKYSLIAKSYTHLYEVNKRLKAENERLNEKILHIKKKLQSLRQVHKKSFIKKVLKFFIN